MSPSRAGALRTRVGGPILESGICEELRVAAAFLKDEASQVTVFCAAPVSMHKGWAMQT